MDKETRIFTTGEVPKILDCTFRDGGYYTAWDFPFSIVQEYLLALRDADIKYSELGFRSRPKDGFRGATAYTTDSFLRSLFIPEEVTVGVMINASEVVAGERPEAIIQELFSDSSDSLVSFVRIAAQVCEVDLASRAANLLASMGYAVGINLMQITETEEVDFRNAISRIPKESIQVVYLADSLGRALPAQVAELVTMVREIWEGPVGFHGHDNRGLAVANSLAATDAGANWVDGTLFGIGRGAGNTQTELLLGHFESEKIESVRTDRLDALSDGYFGPLLREKKWGPNFHYARAASKGIHPTFVQELLDNSTYSSSEVSEAINQLGASNSTRFKRSQLEGIDSWLNRGNSPPGEWDQSELFEGRKVLFLGGGRSLSEHECELKRLAKTGEYLVIAANLGPDFARGLVDLHVACNRLRLSADASEYVNRNSKLIAPMGLIPDPHKEILLTNGQLLDIGITIDEGNLWGEIGHVTLPRPNVLAFGLIVALTGRAAEIYLAGFDGYSEGDPRRNLEQTFLDEIQRKAGETRVTAVTPTRLNLNQGSLYSL